MGFLDRRRCLQSRRRACTTLDTARLHESVVVVHQKVAFNLLERVQDYAYHNQQRGAAVELSELIVDMAEDREHRQDCNERQEYRAWQSNTRHYVVEELHGLFSWLHSRDVSAALLHFVCHLLRAECDSRVEVREYDHEQSESEIIPKAGVISECSCNRRGGLSIEMREHQGDEHQSLSKDDRHNARSVNFERNILPNTAILFVANNPLGILYGNLASTLNKQNGYYKHKEKHHKFHDESYQTAAAYFLYTRNELGAECEGQSCDDTDHNQQRNAVSYSFVRNTFTQPHYKHGARRQDDDRGESEPPEPFGEEG